VNFEAWKQELIDFRTWLKSKGYQDKPLLISEFSIPKDVTDLEAKYFMFEQLLPWLESYTDPNIGYPYDGYHLAQGWIYFNLEDTGDSKYLYGPNNAATPTWGPSVFGQYWIDYVSTPTNGVMPWPCQWHSTPQAWGPGAFADGSDGGSSSSSSSSSGGVPLELTEELDSTPTPTPSITPTPTPPGAYPGP
jgi:hypothetical protein